MSGVAAQRNFLNTAYRMPDPMCGQNLCKSGAWSAVRTEFGRIRADKNGQISGFWDQAFDMNFPGPPIPVYFLFSLRGGSHFGNLRLRHVQDSWLVPLTPPLWILSSLQLLSLSWCTLGTIISRYDSHIYIPWKEQQTNKRPEEYKRPAKFPQGSNYTNDRNSKHIITMISVRLTT